VRGGRAKHLEADARARLDRKAALRLGVLDVDRERDIDRLARADPSGRDVDAAEDVARRGRLLVPPELAVANLDLLDVELLDERLGLRLVLGCGCRRRRAEVLPVAAAVGAAHEIEPQAVDTHAADLE